MLDRIDLRGRTPGRMGAADLSALLPRAALDVSAAIDRVRPICEDVRVRGAAAVRDYTARFDGVDVPATAVPPVLGKSVDAVQLRAMLVVVTVVDLRPVGIVGACVSAGGAAAVATFEYGPVVAASLARTR